MNSVQKAFERSMAVRVIAYGRELAQVGEQ